MKNRMCKRALRLPLFGCHYLAAIIWLPLPCWSGAALIATSLFASCEVLQWIGSDHGHKFYSPSALLWWRAFMKSDGSFFNGLKPCHAKVGIVNRTLVSSLWDDFVHLVKLNTYLASASSCCTIQYCVPRFMFPSYSERSNPQWKLRLLISNGRLYEGY